MTDETTAEIAPDTKDWTWVLDHPCPDCGFDPTAVDRVALGDAIRDNTDFWVSALASPRAGERPEPTVWSPTEYACHVRDVHRVFLGRVEQMLAEEDPRFANWDQDETAVAERYDEQRAADVVPDLVAAAEAVADAYDRVPDDAWARPGRRSNGSVFTVESLGSYHLHDLVHHRWDVRWIMAG
ncbi:DinB family protein [Nocardioides daeguensis]|uniref:Maleylpyruvate isomerase N-terminal domain-containing protein n=1 Tax=Nocardioides daeguensis TaxID=908359 RepID=A0ABP6W0C9_9ACTN|nr:DinB family protein [Nocardioides daeguensis]MBV6726905.1 DinB family protein [Nocardioides daeguensis]MCR1772904.1 DinB family protein [Nocardioides daeguensis]